MTALISDLKPPAPSATPGRTPLRPLANLVLVRISAAGGATRVETIRDLTFAVAHKLSPGEWRREAETALAALVARGAAEEKRGRYTATEAGLAAAARFLALRPNVRLGPWPELRDSQLTARALGLEGESTPKLKALATPEGLRAVIVQNAFGLPRRLKTSPAKLRGELALIALERAFGNKIKSGLGSGTALSAKAGRMLAAQLLRRPREPASDSRLIADLAAEAVDAVQPSLDVLRAAIMKRFVSDLIAGRGVDAGSQGASPSVQPPRPGPSPARAAKEVATAAVRVPPAAANDATPRAGPMPTIRPDLDEFAAEVVRRAAPLAEGWPGNRRAFICDVWPAIRSGRPEWGLSDIEFKCMLVEAHRAGRLALATADLKNKNNIKQIQDSAISYMNTVWHLVRVED